MKYVNFKFCTICVQNNKFRVFKNIKETGYFKKKNLRFVFPVNQPGLGDRFIMASNILFTMKEIEHESCIVDIFLKNTKTVHKSQYLNLIDFYDIIDFFHFKRPDESESSIITNIIDDF